MDSHLTEAHRLSAGPSHQSQVTPAGPSHQSHVSPATQQASAADIPLTGDAEVDADIMAFLKARNAVQLGECVVYIQELR